MLPPPHGFALSKCRGGGRGGNQSPGSGSPTPALLPLAWTDRQVGWCSSRIVLSLSPPPIPNLTPRSPPSNVQPAPMCVVGRWGVRITARSGGLGPRPKSRMTDDGAYHACAG